jgi:serine/threonine protein kinase
MTDGQSKKLKVADVAPQLKAQPADDAEPISIVVADDPFVLENVEIIGLIGTGGMGSVYKVWHKVLNKALAMKVARPELLSNDVALRRFYDEAKAASALTHVNMAGVYDFGKTADGKPFLLMEHCDGITLAEALKTKSDFDRQALLNIFSEITDAVIHAHMKGILHRDLKPANIMVTKCDGIDRIKILDFGIAKFIESDTKDQALTKTGDVLGTPYYMSPEQGMGLPLDKRSDIYAIGCIMYEALIGRPPFQGQTPVETIVKHTRDAVPRFSDISANHGIPESIERVVLKCLAKDPNNRYQTADQLKVDLELVKDGREPLSADEMPESNVRKKKKTDQRTALAVSISMCVALALASHYAHYFQANTSPEVVVKPNMRVQQKSTLDELKRTSKEIEMRPDDKFWYMKRARLYGDLHNCEAAIADYTKVLELDPKDIHAFNNRGREYQILGQYNKALADINAALGLDKNHANALSIRSAIYCNLKRYDEAIRDADRCLQLIKDHPDAYNSRGVAHMRLGHYETALADFTKSIEFSGDTPYEFLNRARVLAALGRADAGLRDYKKAVELGGEPDAELLQKLTR